MLKTGKNALTAALVGCTLVCGVVALGQATVPQSQAQDGVVEVQEESQAEETPLGALDSGSLVIEDDEVPLATGEGTALTNAEETAIENKVIAMVNSSRKQGSKSKLTKTKQLEKSSDIRAKELSKSFSHTRPNGKSWTTAFTKAGVKVSKVYCGENLAMKKTVAKASYSKKDIVKYATSIHTSLMNSPSHKKNIMSGNYKKIGISVRSKVGNDGRVSIYLSEHFCSK